MSSLLRPVGHLPASVYWFRRGLVLAVVVLLLILVVRLFGGGGQTPENTAATQPQQDPSSAPPVTPSTTPTSTPTPTPTQTSPAKTTPPADLTCGGSDVRVTALPANRKIVSGSVLNFVISFEPVGDGCKASIDAGKLTVSVSSGNDLIWTTTHCAQAVPRATLVVAKGKQVTSAVPWNGHRSGPGCLPGQPVAKPGTYVVKAEYDGRPSAPQAFQIV